MTWNDLLKNLFRKLTSMRVWAFVISTYLLVNKTIDIPTYQTINLYGFGGGSLKDLTNNTQTLGNIINGVSTLFKKGVKNEDVDTKPQVIPEKK
jgi:hypothetical protein